MKWYNHLYYSICKTSNIRKIYDEVVSKNTKNKNKVLWFDNYYMQNIMYIKLLLSSEKYHIFFVHESKLRAIMSQNMIDKLINHLVSFYILKPSLESCLIDTNVATGENKDSGYAIHLLKKYLHKMNQKYKHFYILKFDASKYFYRIDHDVLKELLKKKIKDKKALKIVFDIIDSTDSEYINEKIKKIILAYQTKNVQNMDATCNVLLYEEGKGLPIGNMTSQLLAVFYLNELDHYINEELGIKYYIRYMDDGILIHHSKSYLKRCLSDIKKTISG